MLELIVVIAANAREWSAFQVQEWMVEVFLPKVIIDAVAGYRGSDLADMVEGSTLEEDLDLNRRQAKRLQDALADLKFQ